MDEDEAPRERDAAYDLRSIGGQRASVREIHESRDEWDREVVRELLCAGAAPPLKRIVGNIVHLPDGQRGLRCVFVQPSGVSTAPLIVPMSLLYLDYYDALRPFL